MRRWIPRMRCDEALMSDGDRFEDDAGGWYLEFEWFGIIVKLGLLRRGTLLRERDRA